MFLLVSFPEAFSAAGTKEAVFNPTVVGIVSTWGSSENTDSLALLLEGLKSWAGGSARSVHINKNTPHHHHP